MYNENILSEFSRDANILDVSTRLHKLRVNKKLTLAKVSEGTGISITLLSYFESGRRYPSINAGKKLVEFFGVSWETVFGK